MEIKYDVFISYSRADQKVAEGVCGYLEANGLRCFIDYRDIPRAAVWARVLPDAIRGSGMMVAVFSPNYNKSLQVERELSIADKAGIPVLPFRISDVPFEGMKSYYFESINWIDAFPEPEKVFGNLLSDVLAVKDATDNWTKGRNPSAGAVTINLDSIDSDIEKTNDVIDPAYEDDYTDGVDALQHLEYADAVCYLLDPALANYRQSQLYLSWILGIYTIGLVPKPIWDKVRVLAEKENSFAEYMMARHYSTLVADPDLAFEYAARSARHGNIFGRYALAKLYDLGEGVEQDNSMGIEKIKELERLDCPPAMREVARHYIYGFSCRKNPRRALKIIERGAEVHSAQCLYELGIQKMYGEIMPRDLAGARDLLKQAVSEGFADAMGELANSYLFDYVGGGYNTNADDHKKLLEILNKGVRLNLPECMSKLAFIYRNCASTVGLKEDLNTAVKWYKRAANLNEKNSLLALGQIYYYGEGPIEADEPQAWQYFKKAASLISSEADYYLGIMCQDGYGQDGKSREDCVSYFENAIFHAGYSGGVCARKMFAFTAPDDFERGFPSAPLKHESMEGVERSEEKALDYLRKGANIGDSVCYYLLGCALTDSSRDYSDEIEGVAMLEKALSNLETNYEAALRLYELYTDGLGVGVDKEKAEEYLQLAKDNISEEDFNSYMSRRSSGSQSTGSASKTAAGAEDGRLNYERALPFCREGASHWDLMRGLSYVRRARTEGYAPADALYDDVMSRLRAKYDKFMAEEHPDFRILAQLHYAPMFQTDIPVEFRRKAFDGPEGEKLKTVWKSLKSSAALHDIFDFPEPSSDFLADATALNRLWWQIRENFKNSPFLLDGISPMTFEPMLDLAEEINNSDEARCKLLLDFVETSLELEDCINNARENSLQAGKG